MSRAPWVCSSRSAATAHERRAGTRRRSAGGWSTRRCRSSGRSRSARARRSSARSTASCARREDELAARSHRRAAAAWDEGSYATGRRRPGCRAGSATRASGPDSDHVEEAGGAQACASKRDGTVTAGNSSPLNDGAGRCCSATRRRAPRSGASRWRGSRSRASGVDPDVFGIAPVEAADRAARARGIGGDLDVAELNEASPRSRSVLAGAGPRSGAAQRQRRRDRDRPRRWARPGARILATLAHELRQARRRLRRRLDLHRRRPGVAGVEAGDGPAVSRYMSSGCGWRGRARARIQLPPRAYAIEDLGQEWLALLGAPRPVDHDLTFASTTGRLGEWIIVHGRRTAASLVPGLSSRSAGNAAGRYRHQATSTSRRWTELHRRSGAASRARTRVRVRHGQARRLSVGQPPQRLGVAHIHFSVFGRAFAQRLVTQMYFPGDPLFAQDPIFQSARQRRGGSWPRSTSTARSPSGRSPTAGTSSWPGPRSRMPDPTPPQTVGPFFAIGLPWDDGPHVVGPARGRDRPPRGPSSTATARRYRTRSSRRGRRPAAAAAASAAARPTPRAAGRSSRASPRRRAGRRRTSRSPCSRAGSWTGCRRGSTSATRRRPTRPTRCSSGLDPERRADAGRRRRGRRLPLRHPPPGRP